MAVEQTGAEASPGPAEPAGDARQADDASTGAATGQQATGQQADGKHDAGQHDAGQSDLDEVKRKFREALERKRSAHASANAEGAQDTGKVHSHGPAATRRSFRRKSGG